LAVSDLVDGLVPLNHVAQLAAVVGHQHLLDAGAVIRNTGLHVLSIPDREEANLLAVNLFAEVLAS